MTSPKDRVFKVLSRETIYEDRFRRYDKAQIQRDDNTGVYTFLVTKDSVAIVPVTSDGRTVLVKNFRYPPENYFWEVCMGGIDEGLDGAPDAALRELVEETGIVASDPQYVGVLTQVSAWTAAKLHVYFVPITDVMLSQARCPEKMDEIVDVRTVSFDEIDQMIDRGDIVCGQSISVLYLIRRYLQRQGQNASRQS